MASEAATSCAAPDPPAERAKAPYVSHFALFLVPAFALALGVLYRRQQRPYAEHLVFGLHGHPGRWQQVAINYGTTTVTTPMGKKSTESTLKRFFAGPANNEITGLCETPDGRVMITKNDGGRIGN